MLSSFSLDRLGDGQSAYVVRVEAEPAMGRRLLDMGLIPGTRVTCRGRSPAGDPAGLFFPCKYYPCFPAACQAERAAARNSSQEALSIWQRQTPSSQNAPSSPGNASQCRSVPLSSVRKITGTPESE